MRKSGKNKDKGDCSQWGPKFLIWIVTSQCNLKCSHCYAAQFGDGELSEKEKLAVVEDAAEAGIEKINLTGGEILLKKESLELINSISEQGIDLSIFTNGTTLNEEIIRELAKNEVFVFLSIDGAKQESHDLIRGVGTWELAISAAESLRNFGVPFATVMSLNNQNYNEVGDYLSLAQKLGADYGCLIPVMPTGRAKKEMILKPEQMAEVLRVVDEAAQSLKFRTSLWCTPFARLITKSKYISASCCRTFVQEMEIDPAGNVLLCDITDVKFSNIREKGIFETWLEKDNNPLEKSLINPKLTKPCSDCQLRNRCRVGCFARAQLLTGNIHAPDPLCPKVAGIL